MATLNHKLKMEPYGYQEEGILAGLRWKRLLIGDEPGLGKCQSLDSIIRTPNGAMRMGDMRVGFPLFGQDGNVYTIEDIYPQGKKGMYRITFSDGSSTKCTEDHLWNVRDANRRRRGKGWTTKTLKGILELGIKLKPGATRLSLGRSAANKWEIPMCMPVQFQEKSHVIPAYTMGAYLGDGSLNGSHMEFSFPDEKMHIAWQMEKLLPGSLAIHAKRHGGINRIRIVNSSQVDKYHAPNVYARALRDLEANKRSQEKFIPSLYLQGSVQQRKALLAGLMDTDGACKKNRTAYYTTSKTLASDVKELVQSLGGVAIIHEYDRAKAGKPREYVVNVRTTFCPFSEQSRKAGSWSPNKSFRVTRYVDKVEYVGEEECQCIKVSAPDELYLTDEYIVTHNTLQAIGIVDTAEAYPCLVICPSSLKINWRREVEKLTDRKALVLENAVQATWPYLLSMGMHHVAICNYESLRRYFVWDVRRKGKFRLRDVVFNPAINVFKSVIIDECHRVKDPAAQQTIFAKGIAEGKPYRILLSGTPVVNRPADLLAQLSIMGRLAEFGGKASFLRDYGGGDVDTRPGQGGKPDEAHDLDRLSDELHSRCMIRREKAQVLTELPAKTRCDIYVDISNREEYRCASDDLARYLREYRECDDREVARKMRMEALVRFMTLRSIAAKGKVRQAIDFCETFLANGKPLILFCSLHDIVDELKKAFPDAVTVTGRDSMADKQAAVDAFQSGEAKLIICSIKAAGVGLTLTASSDVAFVELPWTYCDCCQCEDRAHRIGQKDNVTCYYLLGRGTIDHALYAIIHRKKSIANQIMATSDEIPTDRMYFEELANSFMEDRDATEG